MSTSYKWMIALLIVEMYAVFGCIIAILVKLYSM